MLVTYTKKELATYFEVSPRTIEEDVRFLKIEPTTGDRNINLYSQADYNLIGQLRKHCADKSNSRESFIPESKVEIVEDNNALIATENNFELFEDKSDCPMHDDPFYDLMQLERCVKYGWTLPSSRLAGMIRKKPRTFTKKERFTYCGYKVTRIIDEERLGAEYDWLITK